MSLLCMKFAVKSLKNSEAFLDGLRIVQEIQINVSDFSYRFRFDFKAFRGNFVLQM